jgi:hypothetical protein
MHTLGKKQSPEEKLICALGEYGYLTVEQATRLLYAITSFTHVREKFKSLDDEKLVIVLGGRACNLPRIFTLSTTGRKYAELLGKPVGKRFRLHEEHQKQHNLFFMQHTLAVNDVLIAARLLSQTELGNVRTKTMLGIILNRMYHEWELKRKIYVDLPHTGGMTGQICIEPDASLDFTIPSIGEEKPWRDFFHVEVYRHLPPLEQRFKQKIQGYVAYAKSSLHRQLFQTSSLSIAVFSQTSDIAKTLKRWTEEALANQPNEGSRFFFTGMNPATASPTELFLTPVWQQAFGEDAIPLLVLEEEDDRRETEESQELCQQNSNVQTD